MVVVMLFNANTLKQQNLRNTEVIGSHCYTVREFEQEVKFEKIRRGNCLDLKRMVAFFSYTNII